MKEVTKLIQGYKKFYKDNSVYLQSEIFQELKKTQSPKIMIISCCDSRVDPVKLTNSEIGEIFVVRNVANLVPSYNPESDSETSAALEFAVNVLQVKHIIVLGHENCGGIRALVDNDNETLNKNFKFIANWIQNAEKIKNTKDKNYSFYEKESIKLSLQNLTSFPCIKEKIDNKKLFIHGWYFALSNASLSTLKDNQFCTVTHDIE